jgi:hypothetical protein
MLAYTRCGGLRISALAVPALLLWIAFNAIIGCSSGSLAFDGGHIPIGGSAASAISGVAFAAESYNTPIAGATVTVTNTSITGSQSTQTAITAADGSFKLNPFLDAPNVNQYLVSVTPPQGTNRVMEQIAFPVTAGQSAAVAVAIPQASFNETLPASVTILKQSYTLHTGDTVAIGAELLDSQGVPLPELPTLVFTGSFGEISSDGLFTSTESGVGTIAAYWNTGTTQLQSTTATITANTSTNHLPPPPPPSIAVSGTKQSR